METVALMQWIQWWMGTQGNVCRLLRRNFIEQWSFVVSQTAEILEKRGKKLASQPGKSIDDVVYCLYRTITMKVTSGFARKYGLQ